MSNNTLKISIDSYAIYMPIQNRGNTVLISKIIDLTLFKQNDKLMWDLNPSHNNGAQTFTTGQLQWWQQYTRFAWSSRKFNQTNPFFPWLFYTRFE